MIEVVIRRMVVLMIRLQLWIYMWPCAASTPPPRLADALPPSCDRPDRRNPKTCVGELRDDRASSLDA